MTQLKEDTPQSEDIDAQNVCNIDEHEGLLLLAAVDVQTSPGHLQAVRKLLTAKHMLGAIGT